MQSKSYATRFWGKADRRDPARIHLLEHHLADVGACFEALLAQPAIRQRLAHTAGWDDVDPATVARLSVFAALHDIGKVNLGFQTRIWDDAAVPAGQRKPRPAGHTLDLTPVLRDDDNETAGWFFDALNWWDDLLTWDDQDGATVCSLFVATLSHHGRPLQLDGTRQRNPALWRPLGELNPSEYTRRIGRLARGWFPDAFAAGGRPLPPAPAFQHHFLGLCNLADWIGSNERWFEYVAEPMDNYIAVARRRADRAMSEIGLNLSDQRAAFADIPGFSELFGIAGDANAIQQAAYAAPLAEPLVIIESETGSGKTEAALWRFARMYEAGLVDGLYFALPTRAAAVQIHRRVNDFIANLFPAEHRPAVVLAVPGYDPDAAADAAAIALASYDYHSAGHHDDDQPWASEHSKRYLAAQIAVGTVDQALLGALKVKNAHLRTASLARNLLVVDEVHASDAYMSEILAALLDAHRNAGGYALLMSATLGSVARRRWLGASMDGGLADAMAVPYPAVSTSDATVEAGENGPSKTVDIVARSIMADFDAVAQRALDAADAGAKVLVVRNTVGHAISTWQAVAERASEATSTLLHHGRYAAGDRRILDGQVEALLGKHDRPAGGCVVVGTQTLEQSLDIDADLLITDLCPVDVLLQRIGRLHRHQRADRPAGYAAPTCIVLTPPADDLEPLLSSGAGANGLGPHGGVYRNLHILEATRRLIADHPQWRIPEMNRELVELATHGDALAVITATLGDAWQVHEIDTAGALIADVQTARNAIIRRDKSFFADNREVMFPSDEERIRTRLGDDRVEVTFDPPPASPFDPSHRIDGIAMSIRWLAGAELPESVAPSALGDGGFEFAIGQRRFRYDRLGLRRA